MLLLLLLLSVDSLSHVWYWSLWYLHTLVKVDISSVSNEEQMLLLLEFFTDTANTIAFEVKHIRGSIFFMFLLWSSDIYWKQAKKIFFQLFTYHFPSILYLQLPCALSCMHTHYTYQVSLYRSACHNHFWTPEAIMHLAFWEFFYSFFCYANKSMQLLQVLISPNEMSDKWVKARWPNWPCKCRLQN